MSNKYVILTSGICNMGGAQMFLNNKCSYLKSKGWNIIVFYYQNGVVQLEGLKTYQEGYVSELSYDYNYYTTTQRDSIISKMADKVGPFNSCVVESHMFRLSLWGELLAKQLHGYHFLAPLEEARPPYTQKFFRFIDFKLKRYEIINASDIALKRFLGPRYNASYDIYKNNMEALCSNVVDEYTCVKIKLPRANYNILTIGRLDKPYVFSMLSEIGGFARNHLTTSFNLITIGGSPTGDVEKRIEEIVNSSNVTILKLGFLFPIPSYYIENADVNIACSNSAIVTAERGIPTILIDSSDFDAIGILGVTTHNEFHRTIEPRIKVSQLLEEVLIDKKYIKKYEIKTVINTRMEEEFSKQLKFVTNDVMERKYYDVTSVYSKLDYIKGNLKRIVHALLNK